MILFYVRHGDPIYNPDQLTPLGHRQAESVAKRLALFGVDEIYASTSTRAIQTAPPVFTILPPWQICSMSAKIRYLPCAATAMRKSIR